MKTTKLKKAASLALFASIGFLCTPASATLVVDQLIGSAALGNSGEEDELAALQAAARLFTGDPLLELFFGGKADDAVEIAVGDGTFYVDLSAYPSIMNQEPGYFVLKFGTGNTEVDSHYFFRNLIELNQLVWTTEQIPLVFERLSHFTLASPDDGTVPPEGTVPEPGSAALLGLGIVGLLLRRRWTQ